LRLSFFHQLFTAFPRGEIRFSALGAELYDKKNAMIGYVPNQDLFVLRKEYEYHSEALKAVKKANIRHESESAIESLYKK
jgi:hypothetical protein